MTIASLSADHFKKNLELFTQLNPLAAYRLEWVWDVHELSLCETQKGEPNLFKKRYGITDYYHAQTGALEEAKELLAPELLKKADVFYVFGLGLGYFYEAFLPWLQENSNHHLVFLEDDLEVLYYFLHTERAAELLRNSQVTLFYFHEYSQDYDNFCKLHSSFANRRLNFLALPYYAAKRERLALTLCYNVLHDASLMSAIYNEYLSGQAGFLANFYRNLLYLPQAHLASSLFGKFENIPAIICGAGPSFHKNMYLLKSLTDRALIFAGGSSLNVLNHIGATPHFGLGVDPNLEQYHRLLTNHTFHLPFLYRPRISHEAFKLMQGPKLYVPGSVNRLASWIEENLGMPVDPLDEGHNIVNLCTEIAYRMGCNPIIYVGMDLAFTEIQTYASGICTHPLWLGLSNPYATENQAAVLRQDIYGQWIKTKWDWIAESTWISHFATRHPDVLLINATEGGLGFAPVPNLTLKAVAEKHLQQSYDVANWVHTEIQNSQLSVKQSTIFNLISELKKSLSRCLNIYNHILMEKNQQSPNATEGDRAEFYTPQTILQESEIKGEVGYQHFLELFERAYSYMQNANAMTYHQNTPLFWEHLARHRFLQSIATQSIDLMTRAVHQFIAVPPPLALPPKTHLVPRATEESYHFSEGHLQIKDPELLIDIDDVFIPDPPPADRFVRYYADEQLKCEMFYLNKQLHGPSRFYSQAGDLLAESWFFKGHREGKSLQYYPSGNLYSLRRFRHNHLQGKQEYFFDNGTPHIVMHYHEGVLQGEVLVYTAAGHLLRELHYERGQRHGSEKMWDTNGQLLIECQYREGIPFGQARQWDPNGWLFKQVDIHHYPSDFDLSIWNAQGERIKFVEHGVEDFSDIYKDMQKRVNELENALQLMVSQMDPLIQQNLKQDQDSSYFTQDLSNLKQSIQEMQSLKSNLIEVMEENLERTKLAKRKRQQAWEQDA